MSSQTDYDKLAILGIDIDAISNTDAISYIAARAKSGQPAAYVVKPYVEFLDRAHSSPEVAELLNHAWLSIADGVALTWAAAYLYAGKRSRSRFWITLFQIVLAPDKLKWPLPDRAAGVNFTWPLLETAASTGLRIYLIGKETEPAIRDVASKITSRFPDANIVGTKSGIDPESGYGKVGDQWLETTANSIHRSKADLILVGMGFPLQERVTSYLASKLDHGVFVGEGGTFDFDSFGGRLKELRLGLSIWALNGSGDLFLNRPESVDKPPFHASFIVYGAVASYILKRIYFQAEGICCNISTIM